MKLMTDRNSKTEATGEAFPAATCSTGWDTMPDRIKPLSPEQLKDQQIAFLKLALERMVDHVIAFNSEVQQGRIPGGRAIDDILSSNVEAQGAGAQKGNSTMRDDQQQPVTPDNAGKGGGSLPRLVVLTKF